MDHRHQSPKRDRQLGTLSASTEAILTSTKIIKRSSTPKYDHVFQESTMVNHPRGCNGVRPLSMGLVSKAKRCCRHQRYKRGDRKKHSNNNTNNTNDNNGNHEKTTTTTTATAITAITAGITKKSSTVKRANIIINKEDNTVWPGEIHRYLRLLQGST